jgi:hypothetical protein
MTEQGTPTSTPIPIPTPIPAPTPPATPPAPEPVPAPAAATVPTDVASLPDWAQKLLRDTRDEAATYRTKAKEVEDQRQASLDAIAKALGLKPEDDPTAAAKTAAEERDAARLEAKAAKVENAVLRIATKHGALPEALTDSRAFMDKLAGLDPAAADFAAQIDAAVKQAVEANPALKSATPPAIRSGGPVGGGIPAPGQLSRDDLKGMTPAEITKAKEEGRLNAMLGIT